MTKKWTYEECEFALNSAWNAFENTMKLHGMSNTQWNAFVFEFGSSGGYEHVKGCLNEFWKEEE